MKAITEKTFDVAEWYKEAEQITPETFMAFFNHLANDYKHDYGTICHAVSACAIAACSAMNETAQGGITGFQAGCVMWGFIQHWMHFDSPLRLINYGEMLYPQYSDEFEKTITINTFEWLQKEAIKRIETSKDVHPDVVEHWKSIVDGKIPFGYKIKD